MRANGVPRRIYYRRQTGIREIPEMGGYLATCYAQPALPLDSPGTEPHIRCRQGVESFNCTRNIRRMYRQTANPEFRAQAIMERMNVEVVCTTDDPVDSLEYHKAIRNTSLKTKVLPTWRPDKGDGYRKCSCLQ